MKKFQENQAAHLEQSSKLKLLMTLTIAGTVLISAAAITYLHLALLMLDAEKDPATHGHLLVFTFFATALITATIVLAGAFIKRHQLEDGGKVVAEDLGGQRLEEPRDPSERRLTNIVEEMAIASGIPVPDLYILECDGINAFAAGHNSRDCVIGVTRGAIKHLKRDELQGVIAHEFAHILNGDMKLNMQMVGWLHGVLAIRIVAGELIELATTAPDRPGTHRKNTSHGNLGFLAIGCALWPIGQIGALISAIVKSSMNREREYLADAYAVEFTRNPEGVANALKRMIGHQSRGQVTGARAIEASHMFFTQGTGRLEQKMRTHPPVANRILRLNPDWDGAPLFPDESDLGVYAGVHQQAMSLVAATAEEIANSAIDPNAWMDRPTYYPEFLAEAAFIGSTMACIPEPLVQVAEAANGSALVLAGLWLAHAESNPSDFDFESADLSRIEQLVPILKSLEAAQQILIFDKAIASLSEEEAGDESGTQASELRDQLAKLANQSEHQNTFHWMWEAGVADAIRLREPTKPRYGELQQVVAATCVVLSRFSHCVDTDSIAAFSFQRGLSILGVEQLRLLDRSEYCWETFEAAVKELSLLAPAPRRNVLLACSSAMTSDQEVNDDEAYLIRGLCLHLGSEMPCILPGQPVAPGT